MIVPPDYEITSEDIKACQKIANKFIRYAENLKHREDKFIKPKWVVENNADYKIITWDKLYNDIMNDPGIKVAKEKDILQGNTSEKIDFLERWVNIPVVFYIFYLEEFDPEMINVKTSIDYYCGYKKQNYKWTVSPINGTTKTYYFRYGVKNVAE